ncbi:MAG: D-alanyl-D-alanine carboxypeptidase [Kiloniellaceae bacterium]
MRGLGPTRIFGAAALAAALLLGVAAAPAVAADASPPPPYIVIDADTGAVLAAENPTHSWYPASVTKAMTAYMVFQALAEGRLSEDQKITVSAAAGQPPGRIGLTPGAKVSVKLLLEAMIVRSANDAAAALAEAVAGSEAKFAAAMTRQAQKLGMVRTVFANASGLPDPAQVTTARDLALMARALLRDFPERFALFGRTHVVFNGQARPSLMSWLGSYKGATGIKTGFTCGSGYNLLAAAERNGRRLIGVVLGGRTSGQRNALMRRVMDAGFEAAARAEAAPRIDDLPRSSGGNAPYVLAGGSCAVAPSPGTDLMAKGELPGWGLVFGSFVSKAEAAQRIEQNQAALRDVVSAGRPAVVARTSIATHRYSALLVGLEQADAGDACRHLQSLGVYCLAVPPKLLNNPQALWR